MKYAGERERREVGVVAWLRTVCGCRVIVCFLARLWVSVFGECLVCLCVVHVKPIEGLSPPLDMEQHIFYIQHPPPPSLPSPLKCMGSGVNLTSTDFCTLMVHTVSILDFHYVVRVLYFFYVHSYTSLGGGREARAGMGSGGERCPALCFACMHSSSPCSHHMCRACLRKLRARFELSLSLHVCCQS